MLYIFKDKHFSSLIETIIHGSVRKISAFAKTIFINITFGYFAKRNGQIKLQINNSPLGQI